jgi:hypothetical protein
LDRFDLGYRTIHGLKEILEIAVGLFDFPICFGQ